jgi:autotransporter-associated beta strand protein
VNWVNKNWLSGRGKPVLLAAACIAAATPAAAQFVYSESFTGSEAPGWTLVQGDTTPGPRLTAAAAPNAADPELGATVIDSEGSGWLRLATDTGYQHNIVALDTSTRRTRTGSRSASTSRCGRRNGHADGISLFVFDAAEQFSVGANGGSLAYEKKTDHPGLQGGYFAVGLDVFGNFSNDAEGRSGAYNAANPNSPINISDALNPNQVVVRGPDMSGSVNTASYSGTGATSYNLLASSGGVNYTDGGAAIRDLGGTNASNSFFADPTGVDNQLDYADQDFRPDQDAIQYRRMQVTLTEDDQLIVAVEFGKDTGLVELYTVDLSGFERPENLRLGFGAATGGSTNVHEIRNLTITASGLENTWYWTNVTGSGTWDTLGNWNPSTYVPGIIAGDGSDKRRVDVVFSDKVGEQVVGDGYVTVSGPAKTLGSIYFSGSLGYSVGGSSQVTLDARDSGLNESFISITNNPGGNADHTLDVNLVAANKVNVDNLVQQSLVIGSAGRSFQLNGNTLEVNSRGDTTILSALTGGSNSNVVKQGSGRLNLYGSNGYNGTTRVEAGILAIRQSNALGSGNPGTTVLDGGTLALDVESSGRSFNAEDLTITGMGHQGAGALRNLAGANTWTGSTTLSGTAAICADAGTTLNFQGNLQGSGDLVKVGAGTLFLNNSKNYTGATIVREGTLRISAGSSLGNSSSAILLGDSASDASDDVELLLTGSGQDLSRAITVGGQAGSSTLGSDLTSGTSRFSGSISLGGDLGLRPTARTPPPTAV